MQINLNQIIPKPLADNPFSDESLWGQTLSFESEEKVIVNARSGKGKSTLISFLYGLRLDFNGSLKLNQQSVDLISMDQWSDLRTNQLSIVFQDLQLFDDLSVWDNIQIKNQLTQHLNDEQIEWMLRHLEMEAFTHQLAKTLSYGQKQRVAIIRALAQPFEYLLMDEPFSHLDATTTQLVAELIETEVNRQEAGFILTTLGEKPPLNYEREVFL